MCLLMNVITNCILTGDLNLHCNTYINVYSDQYLHTTRKRHPNNNALLVTAISSGTVEYKRQRSLEMDSKTLICKLHVFWVSYLHVTPNVSASVNISRPHPAQRLNIRPRIFSSVRSVIYQNMLTLSTLVVCYINMKTLISC